MGINCRVCLASKSINSTTPSSESTFMMKPYNSLGRSMTASTRFIIVMIVLSVCIGKTSSVQPKVLAASTPQKSKEGSSIFDKLRIPEETKMLPWQVTLLLRLTKPKFLQDNDDFLMSSSSPREKLLSVQLLSNAYKWLGAFFDKVSVWGVSHKKNFGLAAKSSVLFFIGETDRHRKRDEEKKS